MITIEWVDEVFLRLACDQSTARELHDHLSCYIENRWFHPLVKKRIWSGLISFFDLKTQLLPIGLLQNFDTFCKDRDYQYTFNFDVKKLANKITTLELQEFYKEIFSDSKYFPRDYQEKAVSRALNNKRGVICSATGSGKSIIIYAIIRWLLKTNKQILMIVPTTTLVEQIFSDFQDYGWTARDQKTNILYSGKELDNSKPLLVSTWQSLQRKPQEFFERFDGLLIDECVHPDTLITMASGKKKKIKNVKVGEKVKTYNFMKRCLEDKEVKEVFQHEVNEDLFEITVENDEVLRVTGNHPVRCQKNYIRADGLKLTDEPITFSELF